MLIAGLLQVKTNSKNSLICLVVLKQKWLTLTHWCSLQSQCDSLISVIFNSFSVKFHPSLVSFPHVNNGIGLFVQSSVNHFFAANIILQLKQGITAVVLLLNCMNLWKIIVYLAKVLKSKWYSAGFDASVHKSEQL